MIKKTANLIFIILFLISCKSMENKGTRLDDESKKEIEEIELLLLKYSFEKDTKSLKNAESLLSRLEEKSKNNKHFEAVILGLWGEMEFLQNKLVEMQTTIDEILRLNNREERLFILKAHQENDIDKKIEILNEGLDKALITDHIKLYLADLYYYKTDFKKAVSLYDEVFVNLHKDYQKYYGNRRDTAFIFIDRPPVNSETLKLIAENPATVSTLLKMSINETGMMQQEITDLISFQRIFKVLTDRNYFNDKLSLKDNCLRKDAAYFFLNLIANYENDTELLNKYSSDFTEIEKGESFEDDELDLSPVPDVKTSDYFYNAVLVLVEREIMELPDGENFFPNDEMSGKDIYESITEIKSYY